MIYHKIMENGSKRIMKIQDDGRKFIVTKYSLFCTALLQVTFVAANVTFIANRQIAAMLITGFMISLIWTLNIKKVAFGGWADRFTYATGAMCGTGTGYFLSHWFTKIL